MIKKINYEKLLYYVIISMIILLPTVKLIRYFLNVYKFTYNYFVESVYLLWAYFPILLFLYFYGLIEKKIKINYTDIIVYVLIILTIISTFFSIDLIKSIFGEPNRYEGLFSLLNYYFVFLNCKNILKSEYKWRIINCFFIIGVIQTIYSILQFYTGWSFVERTSSMYASMGLCAHPNFFGSYMVMLSLLAVVLFLVKGDKKYLFLTIVYIIGLCLAGSIGPFIGFILAFIFFVWKYHSKTNIKKIIIIIFTIIMTFTISDIASKYEKEKRLGVEVTDNYSIKEETQKLIELITNKKTVNNSSFGNGRITIWRDLLPSAEKYWIIGSGPDTIRNVSSNKTVDKAHNIYLQMLVTTGVFSLLFYCILCLIVFVIGLKFDEPLDLAMYASFIGYSVQAFANISVIDVAPYFFMILGFLCSKINNLDNNKIINIKS